MTPHTRTYTAYLDAIIAVIRFTAEENGTTVKAVLEDVANALGEVPDAPR